MGGALGGRRGEGGRGERDVYDAGAFGFEVDGAYGGQVAEGVEVALAAVGLEGCVVEEEVRVGDVEGVGGGRDAEGDGGGDGFFGKVEGPEVGD